MAVAALSTGMTLRNGLVQQISTRFFTGAFELRRVEFTN
jgi:hypothetical protein